jgi:CRP-like cAMP-binding protein
VTFDLPVLLQRNRWFERRSPALQQRLCAEGAIVRLAPGQWVYSEGDPDTGLYAVLDGALRLEVAVDADRDVLIGLAQPVSILGQSRRRGGGPRIVTTRAQSPTTIFSVSDTALDRIAATHPDIWKDVSELVYEQLDAIVHLTAQLLVLRPRARVAARLLQLAVDGHVQARQSDLAEMCGMTRKAVNDHLAALEADGLIQRGYGAVTLLSAAGMTGIARGLSQRV